MLMYLGIPHRECLMILSDFLFFSSAATVLRTITFERPSATPRGAWRALKHLKISPDPLHLIFVCFFGVSEPQEHLKKNIFVVEKNLESFRPPPPPPPPPQNTHLNLHAIIIQQ